MAFGGPTFRGDTPSEEGTARRMRRNALLLLGMHRSGTSLLAYLLHARGAALPDDVIGPGRGNPLGHWEPRNLVAINDDALRALGRSWDDPRSIDQGWFDSRAARAFIDRIIAQIDRDYAEATLLLIKDPRICRLLPLYLAALDALDIRPLVIHQLRPFPEVGRSLADRDGIEPAVSEFLWVRSIVEGERSSRSCRRTWTTLDQVLGDWQATTSRIAMTLGFAWMEMSEGATAQAARFVDPGRCHRPGHASVCADASGLLAAQVWEMAQQGIAGDEEAMRTGFDRVGSLLRGLDQMMERSETSLSRRNEQMLAGVYHSTSWRVTAPLRALKRLIQ
jgi:hypothetical protein